MTQSENMTQKEITEFVFENLKELSTTDLIQLCRTAEKINNERTEQCRKNGLFGDCEGIFENNTKSEVIKMNKRKAGICTMLLGIILLALWISSMLIKNKGGTSLYEFISPMFSSMFIFFAYTKCINRFYEWLIKTE